MQKQSRRPRRRRCPRARYAAVDDHTGGQRELERALADDSPPSRRPRAPAARAGAALPRYPGQDHPALRVRRAVRPHAAVDADRGGGGAASRFRRRDQGQDRCRRARREPVGTRNPAILYGVGNILENAVDFARDGGGGERAGGTPTLSRS